MTAMFTSSDKRVSMEELVTHVQDGDWVAVGGGLSSREPMALLRALIRAGLADTRARWPFHPA